MTFSNNAPDPEVDSNAVQDFLASMEDAFRAHPLWAGSSEEELESAGEVNFEFLILPRCVIVDGNFLLIVLLEMWAGYVDQTWRLDPAVPNLD